MTLEIAALGKAPTAWQYTCSFKEGISDMEQELFQEQETADRTRI